MQYQRSDYQITWSTWAKHDDRCHVICNHCEMGAWVERQGSTKSIVEMDVTQHIPHTSSCALIKASNDAVSA